MQITAGSAVENTSDSIELNPMQDEFRIGDWLVKPQINQLQHIVSAETRHLEPRLAKLLCFLASHSHEVVERDTLVSVLWPRVIVNENSLTRAVSELRKQLQWQSNNDVFIETIPKRGYRLVQDVVAHKDEKAVIESNSTSAVSGWISRVYLPMQQSGALAFGLVLVLAGWLSLDQSMTLQDSPTLMDEVIPSDTSMLGGTVTLSKNEMSELETDGVAQPAFANDQKRFAYIQYGHTGSTIFLGEIASDYEPVAIFNSQDVLYNLTWSPLDNSLLFASKPILSSTALFDTPTEATLYALNLESLELNELVEQAPSQKGGPMDLSLT